MWICGLQHISRPRRRSARGSMAAHGCDEGCDHRGNGDGGVGVWKIAYLGFGDPGSPNLRRELRFWMKLLTVWWFWRCGLPKPCNSQQNDVEIELWRWFWRPWVARTQARAEVLDEIADSMRVLAMRPSKSVQLSAK